MSYLPFIFGSYFGLFYGKLSSTMGFDLVNTDNVLGLVVIVTPLKLGGSAY